MKSTSSFFHKLQSVVLLSLIGGAALVPACSGSDVTCGDGTTKQGSTCVASVPTVNNPDGGPIAGGPPTFAGITSVAPASDVAVQVTWQPATDAITPTGAIVYNVYGGTAAGQENFGVPLATSPKGGTSLLIGNLPTGTPYFFVVRAKNASGVEDTNTVELSGTPAPDTTAPTFAGAVGAETVDDTSVKVTWAPGSDDLTKPEGLTYTVLWSTSQAGAPTGNLGAVSVPGATSAVVTHLPAAEATFYFTVRASDAAGNVDDNEVTVMGTTGKDTNVPEFGGCTAATNPGSSSVTVAWDPGSDDTTPPDKLTYNVYAFETAVDKDTPFGAPAGSFTGGTSGLVDGLKPDKSYYFVCRAQDASGNEDTNIVSRTTHTQPDDMAPVFGGLTKVAIGSTSADLSWSSATDDQTKPEQIVYLVYYGTAQGSETGNAPLKSNPGDLSMTVTGLNSNTQYYFTVRAQDRAQNADTNTVEIGKTTLISFENDIQPIFTSHCVKDGCHSTNNPPQGLILADGYAYSYLVDDGSVDCEAYVAAPSPTASSTPCIGHDAVERPGGTTFKRVLPIYPDSSYMYMKITGNKGIILSQMPPPPNDAPTDAEKNAINQWITQGALDN